MGIKKKKKCVIDIEGRFDLLYSMIVFPSCDIMDLEYFVPLFMSLKGKVINSGFTQAQNPDRATLPIVHC